MQRHIITIEVEDKPGVLTRISSLFARRGFNIESLTVGHTHKPGISRFTVVVEGDEKIVEQIKKQTQKLIHVHTAVELDQELDITREFAVIKVKFDSESKDTVKTVIDFYGARTLDLSGDTMVIEISGSQEKVDKVFEELSDVKIIEALRTGKVGMKSCS